MIIVMCGTGESRKLISLLSESGYGVTAAVRTDYGSESFRGCGAQGVITLDPGCGSLIYHIRELGIRAVVDATHPFASGFSDEARAACRETGIEYIRFSRRETSLPPDPLVYPVYSWEEAAARAAAFGGTVFLTTGSNSLDIFLGSPLLQGTRIVVRVLPEHRVIKKCQDMGLSPRDIVALHGPFSVKLNRELFKSYRAAVVVTRDGGPPGGTENKIKGALSLKIPVVLISRGLPPEQLEIETLEQVLERVRAIKF